MPTWGSFSHLPFLRTHNGESVRADDDPGLEADPVLQDAFRRDDGAGHEPAVRPDARAAADEDLGLQVRPGADRRPRFDDAQPRPTVVGSSTWASAPRRRCGGPRPHRLRPEGMLEAARRSRPARPRDCRRSGRAGLGAAPPRSRAGRRSLGGERVAATSGTVLLIAEKRQVARPGRLQGEPGPGPDSVVAPRRLAGARDRGDFVGGEGDLACGERANFPAGRTLAARRRAQKGPGPEGAGP